jgi:phosphopentomutase
MSNRRGLSELVEEAVDQGATTVEEIHRQVANLPITVLEQLGLFEQTVSEVRRIQDTSIGAIYDLIRAVNHSVTKLASELLDQRVDRRDDEAAA